MVGIIKEAAVGSFLSVKQIAIIVIPLMVFMEILKDMGVLNRIANLFSPVVKIYGMKKESGFPLVIGIIIGLSYGAGIIFRSSREDNLPKRDLYLITYFLVSAHAVFEDTAIFMAIGASGALLLVTRLLVAAFFTFLASRLIKDRDEIMSEKAG
ncbi:MAG TPA: nucleoside recognition protein [Thermoanaerobacterales bacterium]|nr:nucleoside recognition protein [Thermoanaerobacterales bacterium]